MGLEYDAAYIVEEFSEYSCEKMSENRAKKYSKATKAWLVKLCCTSEIAHISSTSTQTWHLESHGT